MGRGLAIGVLLLLLVASAAAVSDTQRLAILAANMQRFAGEEYALECGPVKVGDTVLNTQMTGVEGRFYCVMKNEDELVFGTFMDAGNAEDFASIAKPMLQSYSLFDPHITTAAMPADLETACEPGDNTATFWPCDEIDTEYNTLYPYLYVDMEEDKTAFLIVSDEQLDIYEEPTALSTVWGFIKGLFGIDPPNAEIIDPEPEYGEFHHAYFTTTADRHIAAVWREREAVILYEGFVTDFRIFNPAEYSLGTDYKQRVVFRLNDNSAADRALWRQFTSGMRITDVAGSGPTERCGNGIKSFDEQCEPGVNITDFTCGSFGFNSGSLRCKNDCTFDTSQCSCVDADRDRYNLSGGSCGSVLDCNDNASMIVLNGRNITLPDGKNLTGSMVHPGGPIDWCGNGVSENCSSAAPDKFTGDGPNCKPVPVVPVCDNDAVCDDDENISCADCTLQAQSCPTNWTRANAQGNYNFWRRAGKTNGSELAIIETVDSLDCRLSRIQLNKTAGRVLVYYNGGAESMKVYAEHNGSGWKFIGDPEESGSGTGQQCWNCPDKRCTMLDLFIPDATATCNPVAACAGEGKRWFTEEDCCDCLIPGEDGICKKASNAAFGPYSCFSTTTTGGGGGGDRDVPNMLNPILDDE